MEDTTYFPLCLKIISYTSFLMINYHYLIIASFIAFFFFILSYLSYPWWSSSFEVDLPLSEGVFDPGSFRFMFIELSSLVLRNKSHPSFLLVYRTFPTIQMHQLHGYNYFICITKNSYASCNCLSNTTFIHISQKLSICLPSLPWHHWDCALIQYVIKYVSF